MSDQEKNKPVESKEKTTADKKQKGGMFSSSGQSLLGRINIPEERPNVVEKGLLTAEIADLFGHGSASGKKVLSVPAGGVDSEPVKPGSDTAKSG